VYIDAGALATITYSDIQLSSGTYTGTGNINADPLFTSGLHLSDFSPCIGTATATGAPATDLEGNTRGTPPDMGAYENARDSSLPVELSSFSAEALPDGVRLKWSTESEVDNLGFILESKLAEGDWVQIASYQTHTELQGQGNKSSRTEYKFMDETARAGQSCTYRLSDVNTAGEIHVYDVIKIAMPDVPKELVLDPPFPNPFNPQTKIYYQLSKSGPVEIAVFDLLGRKVRTLVDGFQSAGSYNIYWHGKDEAGMQTATGTYFITLKTVEGVRTQKVVMMR
ncbi:T9SS type A sorting domain-containing protein, partial [candidate division KSB1 bacterium]|nr:T9SS type A sorting domain-containing protein [candidate division KSB1 bacterium]